MGICTRILWYFNYIFCKELLEPLFIYIIGWLTSISGQPDKAFCKCCEKILHAHRLSLLKHTCSLKHNNNYKAYELKFPTSSAIKYNTKINCRSTLIGSQSHKRKNFSINFTTCESNSKSVVRSSTNEHLVEIKKEVPHLQQPNDNAQYVEYFNDDVCEDQLNESEIANEDGVWLDDNQTNNSNEETEENHLENIVEEHNNDDEVCNVGLRKRNVKRTLTFLTNKLPCSTCVYKYN